MKIFSILKIADLVIDGVRAVIRVIRKGKEKNKWERTLDGIGDIIDVIPGQDKTR